MKNYKVLNFSKLKDCGFEYEERRKIWKNSRNKNNIEFVVNADGKCEIDCQEYTDKGFDSPITYSDIEEFMELTLEMTEKGCFKEPSKSLEELGWSIDISERSSLMGGIRYGHVENRQDVEEEESNCYIWFDLENEKVEPYYVCSDFEGYMYHTECLPLSIELLHAILDKLEELKN